MRAVLPLLTALFVVLACSPSSEPATATDAPAVSPRARLRLSGRLDGYLEPCGCADNQLGGLARRAFKLRQDRAYDVLIEGGGAVPGATELDVEKLLTLFTVLDDSAARYDAFGVARRELELPDDMLLTFAEGFGVPVVSSDLVPRDPEHGTWPIVAYVERHRDGAARVRIASLTVDAPAGFEIREPAQAWRAAMEGTATETLRVLLVHADTERAADCARLTPRPDLIVAVNGAHAEPPNEFRTVAGVPLVHPGTGGRYLLDVTLTRIDGAPAITRYAPIPLAGSRTAPGAMEDPDVVQLLNEHRFQVRDARLREALAGRLPTPNGARYVGSAACAECHEAAYRVWQGTRHGRAWQTLVDAEMSEKYPWPVTHYPDCVGCHVVGYMEQSGFVAPDSTPLLRDVGCEQCHGPGSEHLQNPQPGDFLPQSVDRCTRCHNAEQTPMFVAEYASYWQKIEHGHDR